MLRDGFEGNAEAYEGLVAVHPVGRIGIAADVSTAAVWLASDDSSFVSGACIDVDGAIGGRLHDPV